MPFVSVNNHPKIMHKSTIFAKRFLYSRILTIPHGLPLPKNQKKSAQTTLETSNGAAFVSKTSNAKNKNQKCDHLIAHNSVRVKEVKFAKQSQRP